MIKTFQKLVIKKPTYRFYCKISLVHQIEMNKQKRVLLPEDVTPLVYKLTLEPDLEKSTYTGSQEVTFRLNKPTKRYFKKIKILEL